MFKSKNKKPSDPSIAEESVKPYFISREKDIENLNDLIERISLLKTTIHDNERAISTYTDYIDALKSSSFRVERNSTIGSCFYYNQGENPEVDSQIQDLILKHWSSKIDYLKEVNHTCQDELDWLEVKVGLGPSLQNKFKLGLFNFDPTKDHV